MGKDTKKEVKSFFSHLFESGGMQYGLFKNGKKYTTSSASQMQNYYRKKMGLKDDAPISVPQFRKLLNRYFHIDIKSVPKEKADPNKVTKKDTNYMEDETGVKFDKDGNPLTHTKVDKK